MIYILAVIIYLLPILIFFKSNIIKILLLTFAYPISLIFLLNNDIELGRIISSIGVDFYSNYIKDALYLATLGYFIAIVIFWRIRKERFKLNVLTLGKTERGILFVIFIVVACIAFPRSMGVSDIRYNLLPGSWGGVFNVLSIIIIYTAKKPKDIFTIFTYLIVANCFLAGERADTSIAILLAVILKNNNGNIEEREISNISFLSLCTVAICTGVLVGASRTGVDYTNVFEYLLNSLFGIGTVVDVIHVYLSSFWYVDNYGNNPDAIFNILYTIIPFFDGGGVSSPTNFTWLLKNKIDNVGGGLFYTPFYIAFSGLGVVFFISLYFLLIRFLFLSEKKWAKYVFVVLIVMQCRIQWYGVTYPFTAVKLMIIMVVIMAILKKNLSKKRL